jgi:hypothetical protein
MGLLILRRKDSGTRNHFLGGTSGPYISGKKKCTPGSLGRQGRRTGVSAPHLRMVGSLRGLLESAALWHG